MSFQGGHSIITGGLSGSVSECWGAAADDMMRDTHCGMTKAEVAPFFFFGKSR